MENTILQVPISKNLRDRAYNASLDYGFSSLQELVRVFLSKLAKKEIVVSFGENPILLSKKAIKQYGDMEKDFKKGVNIYKAQNSDELIKKLTSNED